MQKVVLTFDEAKYHGFKVVARHTSHNRLNRSVYSWVLSSQPFPKLIEGKYLTKAKDVKISVIG